MRHAKGNQDEMYRWKIQNYSAKMPTSHFEFSDYNCSWKISVEKRSSNVSIVMNSFQKDPNDSNLLVIVSDLSSKCDVYVCFKAFPSFFRVKRIPSQQKLPCPEQNFPCFLGKLLKVGNKSLASLGISKGMTNWNTSHVKRNKLATPIFPTLKKSLTESTEEMLIKPFWLRLNICFFCAVSPSLPS